MSTSNMKNTNRREFLYTTGRIALGTGLAAAMPNVRLLGADEAKPKSTPESLTKMLYETLSPKQREATCFDWNYEDARGLLRTHVAANWDITDHYLASDFFTADQREIVRNILEGIISTGVARPHLQAAER